MIAAAITLVLAVLICLKVKTSFRFAAFVAVIILLLPLVSYTVQGAYAIISGMTAAQVLQDFGWTATMCYTEPFRLVVSPEEGGRPLNVSFAIVGSLVILGSVIALGQLAHYSITNKEPQPAT